MRCDSHVHIVGPIKRYPQAASRSYLADIAPLAELQRRAAARDISRFVIVQPSFYGADNTLLLESLDSLGTRGRGVAVVDPATTPRATLDNYAARGVRGLRINLYSPRAGPRRLDLAFAAMAPVARAMNWHVELVAAIGMLAEGADMLARAAVPVVIDHYGLHGGCGPESAEGRRLIELLRLPHVWIKLSAPYRVSDDALATRPNPAWLAALLAACGERCVWGSDWPYTPPHSEQKGGAIPAAYRDLSYGRLVDDFFAALPSAAPAERIMADNAARLYGFAASA